MPGDGRSGGVEKRQNSNPGYSGRVSLSIAF